MRFASEGELSGGTLGYLDGDTIVLSPESKQPVLDTYIHEVTHALKQTAPESYRQYQQGILDILGDETLNSRTQIAVEKLRERYEATSGEVSESQLNDELTAEFTSWVLQTNVQTLENSAGIHRNVFQHVYDALSEVWQRIKLGASDGEASASLKNVLGLDLDDVDVERIESTLEALRDVFGESEANVRAVGRSHEAGVPSYRLAEQSEILSNESSEKGFTSSILDDIIDRENVIRDGSHMKNGQLQPNVTYQAGEHEYLYRTDAKGRIVQVWVESLQPKTHKGRLRYNPRTLEKLPADHAAHLIGDQFGGSRRLDNILSLNKELNLGEYLKMEMEWRNAISMGFNVSVDISVGYEGDSMRPSSLVVIYNIGDQTRKRVFLNKRGKP